MDDEDEDETNIKIGGDAGESHNKVRIPEEMNYNLDKIIKDCYSNQNLLFCIT